MQGWQLLSYVPTKTSSMEIMGDLQPSDAPRTYVDHDLSPHIMQGSAMLVGNNGQNEDFRQGKIVICSVVWLLVKWQQLAHICRHASEAAVTTAIQRSACQSPKCKT